MRIDSILFDLDSVLYDPAEFLDATLALSVKAMIEQGLDAKVDPALQELKEIRKPDSNAGDHLNRLCRFFNGHEDPLIIAAGVEKYWDCKIGNMSPVEGAHHILKSLSRKYPLALISNGVPIKQAGKLVRLGLGSYFTDYDDDYRVIARHLYFSVEPDKVKPHAFLFEQAQKEIGFSYSNTVMIGDRLWIDVLGANRLGMTSIHMLKGAHSNETPQDIYEKKKISGELEQVCAGASKEEIFELLKPDYQVATLYEAEKVIAQIEKI